MRGSVSSGAVAGLMSNAHDESSQSSSSEKQAGRQAGTMWSPISSATTTARS